MSISPETIDWVAKLAYIEVSETEKTKFAERLAHVLDYVSELSRVDTEGVAETMQITGLTNALAPDEIQRSEVTKEALLGVAPQSDRGMVRVPKIIEKG